MLIAHSAGGVDHSYCVLAESVGANSKHHEGDGVNDLIRLTGPLLNKKEKKMQSD